MPGGDGQWELRFEISIFEIQRFTIQDSGKRGGGEVGVRVEYEWCSSGVVSGGEWW